MQESMVQKVRGKMRPVRLMYARQLSPKSVQHHSLFPGDAAKKQNPKADHAGKAGNPVRQQQCLSDSPTR
jgi:hypothetical protein